MPAIMLASVVLGEEGCVGLGILGRPCWFLLIWNFWRDPVGDIRVRMFS